MGHEESMTSEDRRKFLVEVAKGKAQARMVGAVALAIGMMVACAAYLTVAHYPPPRAQVEEIERLTKENYALLFNAQVGLRNDYRATIIQVRQITKNQTAAIDRQVHAITNIDRQAAATCARVNSIAEFLNYRGMSTNPAGGE